MSDVANDGTDAQNPADNWSFETKQIHVGQSADAATNARALPIYQTTSYVFNDTTHAANLFGLAEPGNIYTRIMNPTQDAVEQRVAALEGGVAALLVASGQAAETYAILNIVENGGHVVSSPRLYGGTYNLFHYTLPKLGIEVSFVEDPEDLDSWQAAVRDNTRAFYGESISNPNNEILDIEGISEVAHRNGVPLIVDNTVATPYLLNPWPMAPTSSSIRRPSTSAGTAPRSAASSSTAAPSIGGCSVMVRICSPASPPRSQLPRCGVRRPRCAGLRAQGARAVAA